MARTPDDAIRIIARYSPEEISLDHDAGVLGTFQCVAFFIGEKYNNDTFWADDFEARIHTANPIGRQNIKNILEEYSVPIAPNT